MKHFWLVALLLLAPLLRAETEAELVARAAALHARIFTIDTHVDTPTASLRRAGWDISQWHDVHTDYSQCDFPRMREGGLKAAVFAVFLSQGPRTPAGHAAARDAALRSFLNVHKVAARFPDQCELALTADDGPRIMATGRRAIYLSIENGYSIGKDLTLIKTYYGLGARIFGITHTSNNDLADSASDVKGPEWGGLSPLGRDAVKECNRLGLVLDASHASDTVLRQLIALSATPVILSHSGVKAVNNHPRNIDDDLLRELATHGGVIQMNTLSDYLIPVPPNPARGGRAARNSWPGSPAARCPTPTWPPRSWRCTSWPSNFPDRARRSTIFSSISSTPSTWPARITWASAPTWTAVAASSASRM